MTSAVDIRGVWHTFAGTHGTPTLEDVSLSVRAGERLGILGPNGGGKSTLLRLVLGLLPLQRGEITVCGVSPSKAHRDGLIGYVPQRPEMEMAMPLTAREVLAQGVTWRLAPWRRVPATLAAQVERTIDLVGARDFADKPVGSLSGGQVQRVLIGRALVGQPRILVLDEPMVGVDAAGQRQFASLLAEIHRTTGVTMLTVTHDLRAIVAGSDQVACLARRLHSHGSPKGLTPAVLAELFSHDVAGLMGELAGMHVHAHGPGETCPDGPSHGHERGKGHGPGCSHAPREGGGA